MRNTVLFGVWLYMMLSVITEVVAFYMLNAVYALTAVVSVLAASQAVAVVLFYMDLKDEPGSLRLFALIPLMFLSALLVAMMASLG
ncbi:MAG: cytochrome C oxidase subunit IV family protein [Nitrososphaerales archaeon]|nr:cytochrome C oxidase subunit IV family protein [Nitrososphaerales archaeon]